MADTAPIAKYRRCDLRSGRMTGEWPTSHDSQLGGTQSEFTASQHQIRGEPYTIAFRRRAMHLNASRRHRPQRLLEMIHPNPILTLPLMSNTHVQRTPFHPSLRQSPRKLHPNAKPRLKIP
ncbi:hypothetical protein BDN70DRAFT_880186 [Pholiota conissans]|uniref:Uncharacterized protein n=1 Tax=Pholiota conissans TaxID=109636 RepID=A0A9P5Z1V6_9AGAR|nr:hypothetical protein BDN70DRAFT_880186 [Pholiota conissans]